MERDQISGARLGGEHGGGRFKMVMWLAILCCCIYTGIKVIPVLVNNFQFQDAIQSTARLASVNHQSNDDVRAAIVKEAKEQEIPIQPSDIHVKGENGNVEISAEYSVTVDLGVYRWTLNFHPSAKNNALI